MSTNSLEKAGLPEQWVRAYERDAQGQMDYADPAWERKAARALAAFILSGIFFLVLPGTFLGVWNLLQISAHQSDTAASAAWIQAHGHAQLFGWVGSFILGISLYVLPKFRGRPLKSFRLVWIIWGLWTAGVALRWWVGIEGIQWRFGLPASAVLELAAFALTQRVLVFNGSEKKKKKPEDLGSWLGIWGFASLGVALIVNLGLSIGLALKGRSPVFPAEWDRTFLILMVWGFVVVMAWGFSTRFVAIFLGLNPPHHQAAGRFGIGIVALMILALARQYFLADLLILALSVYAIWAVRLFHKPARPAKLAGAYRHYPAFIRLAYAWLVAGAALGVAADLVPRATGLGGASRHAVTVGFVALLILALGPRMLPSFLNGRELYSTRWMAASLWLLSAGCLLRVSSEAVAYSLGGSAWNLLPVSAYLEFAGVLAFVVNMAATMAQPLPAWFAAQGISDKLPLYWYVTSFPKTRSVLIRAGLKTLSETKNTPRSLSLAEAAAADHADLNHLVTELNAFFNKRQPRRVSRKE
jgi:uncharacterized protein involved in response to NO